jgi:hypothetical protein
VLLFHHDPLHTDSQLDLLHRGADEHWQRLGGSPGVVAMAVEGEEIELGANGTDPAGG